MEQVNEQTSLLPKAVGTEACILESRKSCPDVHTERGGHSPAVRMGGIMYKAWEHRAIPSIEAPSLGWLLLGPASQAAQHSVCTTAEE